MGLFDVMDLYPYPIRVYPQETGGYDNDGVWQQGAVSGTVIKGHLSLYTRSQSDASWRRTPAGITEQGSPRLFSYTFLPTGTIVEVERTATPGERVDRYRVMGMVHQNSLATTWVGDSPRWEYDLREEAKTHA